MAFEHILVTLDGSASAEQALAHAGRIGQSFGSRVLLLRVLDTASAQPGHCPDSVDWQLRRKEAAHYMRATLRHPALRGLDCDWCVVEGRPAEQIMRFIEVHDVDLVVLSAHGVGGAHAFPFGGTAQKIASIPDVSCIVVRGNGANGARGAQKQAEHYRRILVPLDGSRRSEWALSIASGMAAENATTELILLHVVPPPEMPRARPLTHEETVLHNRLAECNRSAAELYLNEVRHSCCAGVPVRTRLLVSGRTAQVILNVAAEENVDLIILAAHGPDDTVCHQKFVCPHILAHSRCPVLVLQQGTEHAMPAAPVYISSAMQGRRTLV